MKACVMIPTYNTGSLLATTVGDALAAWKDVYVVVDGSTDGSAELLDELKLESGDRLRVIKKEKNQGKGAAILTGIETALADGFTHALSMDADGQHPASSISKFIAIGKDHPDALVLGEPVFDDSAPALRVGGRKISNWWANLVTFWWGIHDSLFGMRLYPMEPLRHVFSSTIGARRFDFDPEVAIRLCWKGVPVINLKTPVRYLTEEEGGVSQFRYVRDNTLLTWMYIRLFFGMLLRSPALLFRLFKGGNPLKHIDISDD
ncbi:MAG: glycosyltransferase family 2 protein [Akkermansiaceae bacterium]